MIVPVLPPRWYQMPVMRAYSQGFKRILYTWPRRHGKDVVMFQLLQMEALKRVGNYWYLFPTRAWAERAIWNNTQEIMVNGQKRSGKLIDTLLPDGMTVTKHEKDLKITYPNGSVMQFSGTDSLDFVGQGGYGYGLSEYSLHRNEVTSYISPILEESNGILIQQGTLRGKDNHLYKNLVANLHNEKCFTQWLVPEITKQYYWVGDDVCVNPELQGQINPETGREYTNIQMLVDAGEVSYALARQEFLNEAVLETDSGYYAREYKLARKNGDIGGIEYDPRLPVYTFWDIGKGTAQKCTDAMSVWFVQFPDDDLPNPKRVNMIAYEESSGKAWAEHARMLNSKGFMYGGHYAPWDINKGIAGIDGTNLQWAKECGIEFTAVPRRGFSIMNAIEICRRRWKGMKFTHDCNNAVDKLASYHEKTDRNGIGQGVPEHDINSNCADAFRTMCEALDKRLVQNQMLGRDNMSWVDEIKFDGYFD